MKKKFIITGILLLQLLTNVNAQYLDSLIYMLSLTKVELDSTLDAEGLPSAFVGTTYGIDVYKVVYHTTSYDSSTVTASGMLAFPNNSNCRFPLLSYNHGTKVEREKVPSRISGSESLIGLIIASNGYITTLPDYLGLGNAPVGLLHLSNHAATLASAGIDLLRAAKEAESQLGFRLNGQLFITGYSEGGYAAMCIHRKIEQSFSSEFTVTASAPMSGAYDLSGVMYNMVLSNSTHPNPLYLPYLIVSWNQKYHFYNQPAEYFQSPYDTSVVPLFDGFTDDNTINSACADTPRLMLRQDLIDSVQNNINHPFRVALRENDAYTNWLPVAPVKMYFCKGDNSVPWQNAEVAYTHLVNAGGTTCDTINVSSTADHAPCAQLAVLYAKSFFEGLRTIDSCSVNGLEETEKQKIAVYPNPSGNMLTIGIPPDIHGMAYSVFDSQGTLMKHKDISGVSEMPALDLSYLSAGIYVVTVQTTNGLLYSKFVKH